MGPRVAVADAYLQQKAPESALGAPRGREDLDVWTQHSQLRRSLGGARVVHNDDSTRRRNVSKDALQGVEQVVAGTGRQHDHRPDLAARPARQSLCRSLVDQT